MNHKLVVVLLVLAIGGAYAGVTAIKYLVDRQVAALVKSPSPQPAPAQPPQPQAAPVVAPLAAHVAEPTAAAETPKPLPPTPAATPAPLATPARTPRAEPAPRQAAPPPAQPVTEPEARVALSLVGADPAAEAVWIQAINDPGLSKDARQNLIEDLNEDGFPDPKNLTADDLPLIVNRIALIEDLAPDAMDDVNQAAFQEAYRDLVNMYNRVTGQ